MSGLLTRVREYIEAQIELDNQANTYRNMLSDLNILVEREGITDDNVFALFEDFKSLKDQHLKPLKDAGKSWHAKSSRLNRIHDIFCDLADLRLKHTNTGSVLLELAERSWGAGRSRRSYSKKFESIPGVLIRYTTFDHYLSGRSIPAHKPKVIESMHAIEKYFSLKGELTDRLGIVAEPKRETRKHTIRTLKPDEINPALKRELDEFIEFKISGREPESLQQKMSDGISWDDDQVVGNPNMVGGQTWTRDGHGQCTSADVFSENALTFFSFLHDHLKLPLDDFRFNLLAHLGYWKRFVSYRLETGQGLSKTAKTLHFLIANTQRNGWFYHAVQPPKGMLIDDWHKRLGALHDEHLPFFESQLEKAADDPDGVRNIKPIMPPNVPIEETLNICAGVTQYLNDRVKYHAQPTFQHTNATALVMFDVSFVCPLRVTNWSQILYFDSAKKDDQKQPSLTKLESGQYRLWVPKKFLKNRSGRNTNDINIELPAYLNKSIDLYLTSRRRILKLKSKENPRFFVNSRGGNTTAKQLGQLFSLRTHDALVSYFGEDSEVIERGINPHAMRHLAATIFLHFNPGDYPALAVLLNDTLQTVIEEYAKLSYPDNVQKICDFATKIRGSTKRKRSA